MVRCGHGARSISCRGHTASVPPALPTPRDPRCDRYADSRFFSFVEFWLMPLPLLINVFWSRQVVVGYLGALRKLSSGSKQE